MVAAFVVHGPICLWDSEAFVAVLQCGPLAVHLTQFLLPSLFVTILLHFSGLNDMPMFLFTPGIQLNVIRVEEAANDWSIVVPFSLKFHCKYSKKKKYISDIKMSWGHVVA